MANDAKKVYKQKGEESIFHRLLKYFPNLQHELLVAYLPTDAAAFLRKAIMQSIMNALLLTIFAFFLVSKAKKPLILLMPIFILLFFVFVNFNFLKLKAIIARRKNAIDREIVFVGRYMLLKLYSGAPLLNVLIEQSKGDTNAAKYVKEIVDDINSGSTIEESLEKAMKYTPSDNFRKILFHISNALKYGMEVTMPLEAAINDIIEDNMVEIQKYGKKMNTLMIFYMLIAVVLPSLGITILIVIVGFIGISLSIWILFAINFFILLVQLAFISIVKNSRPSIEI